jgi:predicted porin
MDEVYLIVRGSFGQLTIGSEDNAGHMMTIGYSGSWATQVGQNLNFDIHDWISIPPGFGHSFDGTINDIRLRSGDNDSDKITYYTPRFSGFQVGASYIPSTQQDQGSLSTAVSDTYHDGFALGVNFDRKFDKFGIGVAAGYLTMDAPEGATGVGIPSDYDAWNVAVRVDFGPFRVSGAYKENNDLNAPSSSNATPLAGASDSGEIYDVGVRYRWGPNGVSLVYSHGEGEANLAVPGDDEKDAAMLSYSRALGPGVKWTANLMWADYSGEDPGSADDNDGYAFTTSIRMGF